MFGGFPYDRSPDVLQMSSCTSSFAAEPYKPYEEVPKPGVTASRAEDLRLGSAEKFGTLYNNPLKEHIRYRMPKLPKP